MTALQKMSKTDFKIKCPPIETRNLPHYPRKRYNFAYDVSLTAFVGVKI